MLFNGLQLPSAVKSVLDGLKAFVKMIKCLFSYIIIEIITHTFPLEVLEMEPLDASSYVAELLQEDARPF